MLRGDSTKVIIDIDTIRFIQISSGLNVLRSLFKTALKEYKALHSSVNYVSCSQEIIAVLHFIASQLGHFRKKKLHKMLIEKCGSHTNHTHISVAFHSLIRKKKTLAHLMSLLVLQSIMVSGIDMSRHTFQCSQPSPREKQFISSNHINTSLSLYTSGYFPLRPYLISSCHNGTFFMPNISAHSHQKQDNNTILSAQHT